MRIQPANRRACSAEWTCGHHDAGGTEVEGAADADALPALDAHEGRDVSGTGGQEERQEVRLVGRAVLEIDEQPVEAGARDDLHEERARRRR